MTVYGSGYYFTTWWIFLLGKLNNAITASIFHYPQNIIARNTVVTGRTPNQERAKILAADDIRRRVGSNHFLALLSSLYAFVR